MITDFIRSYVKITYKCLKNPILNFLRHLKNFYTNLLDCDFLKTVFKIVLRYACNIFYFYSSDDQLNGLFQAVFTLCCLPPK